MGKGHQVNGEALKEVLKKAGYNPDAKKDLRAFCKKAGISLTTLKRWLTNGGIHEDKLHDLAELLNVDSWEDLSLRRQYDAPPRAAPRPKNVPVKVITSDDYHVFTAGDNVVEFIATLSALLAAKKQLHVYAVDPTNSVEISIGMGKKDVVALIKAFRRGRLDALRVIKIVLPLSVLQSPRIFWALHMTLPHLRAAVGIISGLLITFVFVSIDDPVQKALDHFSQDFSQYARWYAVGGILWRTIGFLSIGCVLLSTLLRLRHSLLSGGYNFKDGRWLIELRRV